MTSFPKPTMSNRLRSFLTGNWIPLSLFLLLLVHGSLLGLSDDEAYYWVLAQKPALGYAFHPPAVAWLIALFQLLGGWAVGISCSGLVRLPAALSAAFILHFSLRWLTQVGMSRQAEGRAALVLLSFCGFFPLAWMMVPDISLFLGWTLLFCATWSLCFRRSGGRSLCCWAAGQR